MQCYLRASNVATCLVRKPYFVHMVSGRGLQFSGDKNMVLKQRKTFGFKTMFFYMFLIRAKTGA